MNEWPTFEIRMAMTDEDQKPDTRVAEFKLLAETAQRMADKAESESARAD